MTPPNWAMNVIALAEGEERDGRGGGPRVREGAEAKTTKMEPGRQGLEQERSDQRCQTEEGRVEE